MAKLSNSPKQALNFDLERRKSFTFRVRLKYSDGSLVNLTGCTLRFVMKSAGAVDDHFDLNNLVVNSEATIGAPLTGEGVFAFQAAELDGDPGEYGYSIVLWSPDNFSTVLAKGVINLLDNSESHSMHRLYSATAPTSALELTLRGGDVVEVEVVSLPQVPVSVDAISWPDVGDKPESFPPSTHGHTINEVTGLATELAGKQPAGNYAASVHQHTVSDVNGLQGALDGKSPTSHNHDGTYAPTTHNHTIANVTGLQGALDAKAASSHGHTIAQVTGLQGALDGKQPAGSYASSTHTHTAANITDFTEATQDIVGSMVAGAGGTYNDTAGTITLPSSGGGGAVDSVAGRTGAVVLSSADLTDGASLATDAELSAGLGTKANSSHTHAAADITSGIFAAGRLPTASATASGIVELATTAEATTGTDTARAVTPAGLKAVADTKANTSHTHTSAQVTDFTEATQDVVGAMVAGAGGTYDDAAGTITLPAGGGGAAPPAISRNVMTAQYRPLPGQVPLARDVLAAVVRTTAYFYPVRAAGAWTVDAFAIKVSTAVAGGVARIWVFNADNLEQPTTLALDATGSGLPLDTAGLKEVSGLNHTFPAGNYVVVLTIAATANPTLIGVGCAPDRYDLAGVSWWNDRVREGASWTSPAQVTTWTASYTSAANPTNLVFWR